MFRDVEVIAPGENFHVAIEKAMASATTILVLIGKDWVFAGYVKEEVKAAQRHAVTQIPVLLDVHDIEDIRHRLKAPEDQPALDKLLENSSFRLRSTDFESDVEKLVAMIRSAKRPRPPHAAYLLAPLTIALAWCVGELPETRPRVAPVTGIMSEMGVGLGACPVGRPPAPRDPHRPYSFRKCQSVWGNRDASADELMQLARITATSACGAALHLDAEALASTMKQCADRAQSSNVQLQLSANETWCTIEARAITWDTGQRWLWVGSWFANGSSATLEVNAFSLRGGVPVP